jgi:hypothetical protein
MCSQFAGLKDDFYLAGGTGLALQLGHRMSDDFDFFTNQRFDNSLLLSKMSEIFHNDQIGQLQNAKQTLTLMIRGVKISFFYVEPVPVTPLLETEYFRIASVSEIGVFKLLALLRAAFKDYVDLYCILQQCSLGALLTLARKKYPGIDEALYLKALLSFDDVDLSPIQYVEGHETTPDVIFESLQHHVDHYLKESMM